MVWRKWEKCKIGFVERVGFLVLMSLRDFKFGWFCDVW